MILAKPAYLFGLLLIPLLILFLRWARSRQKKALAQLGDKTLINRLISGVNWSGRRWQNALRLAALALVIVALARPQWGTESRQIDQEGLQVIVALDVSQSMLAQDIKPTRLDRAKLEISDLMERLDGDEIGLVLFSGASFVQVPLTSDYQTALNYLDSANPTVISRPGTVIGDAIRTAMTAFDENLSSQKVLIVMTDGEDRETDPVAAAEEAAGEDVLIYTIGFGTVEGQPVPETTGDGQILGYKTDQQGQPVLSKLDERTLQAVAEAGGGDYFMARADGRELDQLLSEIDGLQKAQLQTRTETRHIERFQIFLALAVLGLVLSELIPERAASRHHPAMGGWSGARRQASQRPTTTPQQPAR
ncbi:MAG: VWA domain-containing protein [Candidatus Promineifilaceae bacterium]